MSFILFPVEKVLLEYVVKLGDCIFFSASAVELDIRESKINVQEKEILLYILQNNKDFWASTEEQAYILYNSKYSIEELKGDTDLVEHVFSEVNRSLDYIRILECPFTKPEYLLGIPGLIENTKYMISIDENFKIDTVMGCGEYYYSMQPGIGLDVGSNEWTDEILYEAIYSNRKDVVYCKYRNLIAEACEALRIRDVSRCFVYLFSKVDGMGLSDSRFFKDNKIQIISLISKNQKDFDTHSNQYYFYSQKLRTEIVHKGNDLLNFVPIEMANKINQRLFGLIIEFCKNVIATEIDDFEDLKDYLRIKSEKFIYNIPEKTDVEELSRLIYKTTTYIASISGLKISVPMKRGNMIILPKWEDYDAEKYQTNYYLKDYDRECDEEFKEFSVEEMEYILHILSFRVIKDVIRRSPIVIGFNLPKYMDDYSESVIERELMVDNICSFLDRCTYYDLLSSGELVNGDILPPKTGIEDSIRTIYEFVESAEGFEIKSVTGSVYGEYDLPSIGYRCICSDKDDIYNILYRESPNYVQSICKRALEAVCESYYFFDDTIRLSYLFDIVDSLYPGTTDGDDLNKLIWTLLSDSKSNYLLAKKNFQQVRQKYRNPILHGGKNVLEIENNINEIKIVECYLRKLIVDYCVMAESLNVSTWEELEESYREKQRELGLIR